MSLDPDFSPDEQEEKARLISQVIPFASFSLSPSSAFLSTLGKRSLNEAHSFLLYVKYWGERGGQIYEIFQSLQQSFIMASFHQVLELQNTLDDLTHRVDKVGLVSTLQCSSEHHFKIARWRKRTWSWKVKMACWDNTLKISCRYRNSCCVPLTISFCNIWFYRPAMCSKQSVPSPGGKKLHQRNRPRQTPKCSLWWKWKWSG